MVNSSNRWSRFLVISAREVAREALEFGGICTLLYTSCTSCLATHTHTMFKASPNTQSDPHRDSRNRAMDTQQWKHSAGSTELVSCREPASLAMTAQFHRTFQCPVVPVRCDARWVQTLSDAGRLLCWEALVASEEEG